MEDPVQYGNRPNQSYTVYKFEVNSINPETFMVQSWENLTYEVAYKIIPANYRLWYEATLKSKDYYLVIHLKTWEDNICYYFVKKD